MVIKSLKSIPLLAFAFLLSAQGEAFAGNDTEKPVRDKWALVVGVGKFADGKIPKLKYASKDARDFRNYLIQEADFAPDHVRLLLDDRATQRRVLSELGNKFLARVAKPDDLVVLYFSSHGSPAAADVRGKNFVVAYDSDPDDLYTTGIEMDKILESISSRVLSERVVLLLDACHSGAVQPGAKGLVRQGNFDAEALSTGSGQMVICSSKPDEQSWESKRYDNGIFTRKLLEGLRCKGRKTTLGDAFRFIQGSVQAEVQEDYASKQTPILSSKWNGSELALAITPVAPQQVPQSVRQILEPDSTAQPSSKPAGSLDVGIARFNKGDFASAVDSLKKALTEGTRIGDAHFYLGRAYANLGKKDEAIKEFSECKQLSQGTKRAEYCRQMIQYLSASGSRPVTVAPLAVVPAGQSSTGAHTPASTQSAVDTGRAQSSPQAGSGTGLAESELHRVRNMLPRIGRVQKEKPAYGEVSGWSDAEKAAFVSEAAARLEKARYHLKEAEDMLKRAESQTYSLVPSSKSYGETETDFRQRRDAIQEQIKTLVAPYKAEVDTRTRWVTEEDSIADLCNQASRQIGVPVLTGGSGSCSTSTTTTTSTKSTCK